MNELYFTINFSKQKFIINGVDLISGDYNSTKIKFNFEDYKEGTKVIEIRPALSEDKNPTFMSTITNNEVILTSIDESDHKVSPFTTGGVYLVEVSVYGNDSKLSTITKSLNILEEQIILSDDIVNPYLPIFDELIQEINTAITETNNLNITITKENGITTITLTKKDGTVETFNILDGIDGTDGVGISNIAKIATVGLVDTYRITLTDGSYYDYQITNGKGIVSITKTDTTEYTDTYTITYNDGTTSIFTVTNGTLTIPELYQELSYITNILPKVSGEGSYISLNNTGNSRLLNLEVDGKSIQDGTPTPINPITINSVGTYNSETNKYNISIQTVGKNLFDGQLEIGSYNSSGNKSVDNNRIRSTNFIQVKPNTNYRFSEDGNGISLYIQEYNNNFEFIQRVLRNSVEYLTTTENTKYITFRTYSETTDTTKKIQLEEGTQITPYEKYESNTQLYVLDEPLRSIGDTKDLLYIENSILKIKRYIKNIILKGTEYWGAGSQISSNYYRFEDVDFRTNDCMSNSPYLCDRFIYNGTDPSVEQNVITNTGATGSNRLWITIDTSIIGGTNTTNFTTWLSAHNTSVLYVLGTPTDETVGVIDLPSTFYNVTNIMTSDSLDPNIRATALKDISNL